MKTKIKTNEEEATFEATREFEADLPLVWRAWTEAELLDQWWAPKPWRAETISMDFRPGGKWRYEMVGPEGERHGSLQSYEDIETGVYFTGQDAFSDSEGNINTELPVGVWKNAFRTTSRGTQVISTIRYPSSESLATILSMGMAEGLSMAQDNLDDLLVKLTSE